MSNTAIQPVGGKSRNGRGPTLEEARHIAVLVLQGMSAAKAYDTVYPLRKKGTINNRSRMGRLIFREYMEKYGEDLKEAAARHEITVERYFTELDLRLKAETLDEQVNTVYVGRRKGTGEPITYVDRKTIRVEDNGTRMAAVREMGRALQIGPQPGLGDGGTQVNGNVYVVQVMGEIRKRPQERALQALIAEGKVVAAEQE